MDGPAAYVSTVRFEEIELRAFAPTSMRLRVRLARGNWADLEPRSSNETATFFRHSFDGLEPDTRYVIVIESYGPSTQAWSTAVETRTLARPASRLRTRFAVVPDLHIRPGAHRQASTRAARRLYPFALELARHHLADLDRRQGKDRVDFVLLLGDTLDPADDEPLAALRGILSSLETTVHVVIGNHELHGHYSASEFHRSLDLPQHGYRTVTHGENAFVLLSTPDQGSLAPGCAQFRWLEQELEAHASSRDTFLSPQLIQAPCGYSLFEVYEDGIAHNVIEIDQQEIAHRSRSAYGLEYAERHGLESHRILLHRYRDR